MKPYSNDLRTRVVQAYEKKEGSQRALARRFAVSLSVVHELLKRHRQTGRVDPKPHGGGYPAKIQGAARTGLRRLVQRYPDATLAELRQKLARRYRLQVSQWTVGRLVRKEQLTRKKKPFAPRSKSANGYKGCARSLRPRWLS